ncbi:MAG TPA: serine protease [Butyricimonas virosa]|uniref:Serine protease n=1 Tax=Butyricimonas virosa TaxID=544645 RepID=A0A921H717_9BACT|nr:serine protease [Butyricimonas virosa]
MNLTRANIKDLRKVTVKIVCSNNSEGSGTIVSAGENLYVLTAAHVIEKDTKDGPFDKEQIGVSLMRNSQTFHLAVDEVIYYNKSEEDDAAVLRVIKPNGMPTSGLDRVRLLTTDIPGQAVLCGFHKSETSLKQYNVENRGNKNWASTDIQLLVQSLGVVNNFEGTSGGGIFYQDTNNVLYMAAYMSAVGKHNGNNNEFECLPSSNFIPSRRLDSIVDNRNYTFIADTGVARDIDSRQLLNPLDRSGYEQNQTGFFIENDRTKEIINQLWDDDIPTLLLTALSGMGKSKLIYEAFKGTECEPNRYYAKFNGNRENLMGELKQILNDNHESDGIIIVDDCPMKLVTEVISIRDQYNNQFRLIFAHHDYFNEELERINTFPVIKLRPQDMEESIGRYISEALHEDERNKNDISEIKQLAGGYPQMAIELVEAYKKNNIAGPEAVTHLMPKLLNLTPNKEEEEKKIWQTLSLCLPFPYEDATHEGFAYLLRNNHVTPLNGMEYEERRSIAVRIVTKYHPTLIDVQGKWLYVRPFPLAVWLTAEWFKYVCNSQIHFNELIEDIKKQPQSMQTAISEGFCKHIQQMSGNKEAFKMVGQLVNADINNPFFDEENLCSGLGSELFLAMSTVNPAAIATHLRRVLGYKDITWLGERVDGDVRRNMVWALERLCFARESYHDGVFMMARLAVAENEEIGNNATAQLVQLFHICLAGTEVNLEERLATLKGLIDEGEAYTSLTIRCFEAALRNGGFVRVGGAEKFGFENRKDYTPNTWDEIFEYWYGCRDLLLEWVDKNPEIVDLLVAMVERNVYNWARAGRKEVFVPILEKIAERKNYDWDTGYETLYQMVHTFGVDGKALGIAELMEKMRSQSFKTQLNEARYIQHGQYRLGDKEQIELSEKLYAPLAAEFIDKEIYANAEEVKALLEDNEYIPIEFVKQLATTASDEQLGMLFDTVLNVLAAMPQKLYYPFLGNLSSCSKDRKPLLPFLERLRDGGHEDLYVSLMAGTEDYELSHFHQLFSEQKRDVLTIDFLPVFLRHFRSDGPERYLLMLKALRDCFPNRPNDLIGYVGIERFMMRKDDQPEAVAIVKDAMLRFQISDDTEHMLYDYSRLLIETLQLWPDPDFAKQVNRKFIDVYNTRMVHLNTKGVFTELLQHYFDDVWPEFIKAFLGTDTFLFYFQVKDELGSGFGFGKGPLFDNEKLIKQLCIENPESAPVRIASMVPCFETDDGGNETEQFSKWILWLLDNFGEQKAVRDGISSNLGSFSWTGDISPYYERNIQCFEQLLSHSQQEVREWAQSCIDNERKLLNMEKDNEAFMKIRYGI